LQSRRPAPPGSAPTPLISPATAAGRIKAWAFDPCAASRRAGIMAVQGPRSIL
jgi:hypothetical protein